MKSFILVPDSFKGTISSTEICTIMERAILKNLPDSKIVSIPVADGGEGSVDAFLSALGGDKIALDVTGPFNEPVRGFYGILHDGTAIVEMAAAAGLPLAKGRENPERATTYGVGEIIAAAAENAESIIIGLGGSATNDGGTGAAAALGVKFFDSHGNTFIPVGGTLKNIARIDMSDLNSKVKRTNITIMCDIDNPFCGENGAAYVFGPQKGADAQMVRDLDDGLYHLAKIIKRDIGIDISDIPGAGAAGGMGGGLYAFLGATLKMGIETVLDAVHFDSLLDHADIVFSGEGRIDGQSARGKVVSGVAARAKIKGVPVIAVVGDIGKGAELTYSQGVTAIFSTNRICMDITEARKRIRSDLEATMNDIMRLYSVKGE